jgi:quercetin dioxygenase-like cupin family protein
MFERWLVPGVLLAVVATPVSAQTIGETVTPVFREAIPNIPRKTLSASVVSYEPGGTSSPHHHAASAFIFAYVLSGAIRSQLGDEPARVYRAGESFFETPGAHHAISENASPTEPAQLLVDRL